MLRHRQLQRQHEVGDARRTLDTERLDRRRQPEPARHEGECFTPRHRVPEAELVFRGRRVVRPGRAKAPGSSSGTARTGRSPRSQPAEDRRRPASVGDLVQRRRWTAWPSATTSCARRTSSRRGSVSMSEPSSRSSNGGTEAPGPSFPNPLPKTGLRTRSNCTVLPARQPPFASRWVHRSSRRVCVRSRPSGTARRGRAIRRRQTVNSTRYGAAARRNVSRLRSGSLVEKWDGSQWAGV